MGNNAMNAFRRTMWRSHFKNKSLPFFFRSVRQMFVCLVSLFSLLSLRPIISQYIYQVPLTCSLSPILFRSPSPVPFSRFLLPIPLSPFLCFPLWFAFFVSVEFFLSNIAPSLILFLSLALSPLCFFRINWDRFLSIDHWQGFSNSDDFLWMRQIKSLFAWTVLSDNSFPELCSWGFTRSLECWF